MLLKVRNEDQCENDLDHFGVIQTQRNVLYFILYPHTCLCCSLKCPMLPLKKEYAAFDTYKLIAQWTTKVDMTNMYKIRKEFSYYYYLMVTSAIYQVIYLIFSQYILLLNFVTSIFELLANLTMMVSNLFECD